jgi:Zn-dependent protease
VIEIDKTYPALEVLLAIVGLLVNLMVASVLFLSYQVLANTDSVMVYVLVQWLAFIFFMLVLFDFLPGLPLDGGRILRALLWKTTSNYDRITKILSWAGWIIGLGFIITGIILIINTREWFVGVLLVLPGLILQNSSTHQRRQIKKQTGNRKSVEEGRASTSTG